MWQTSCGDRTLFGAEASLVGMAIDSMINELQERVDDCCDDDSPYRGHYGFAAYDSLSHSQRIGLLHQVAHYLLAPTREVLPLSASSEAAIACLFVEIRDSITVEIEISHDGNSDGPIDLSRWRRAVRNAYIEVFDVTADAQNEVPAALDNDKKVWSDIIDQLASRILWDRDFELIHCFLDADPEQTSQRRRLLGIEHDYFTRVVPDPRLEELDALVDEIRGLVRSKVR